MEEVKEIKEDELIDSFKRVEKKLCSAIKKIPSKIHDDNDSETLKKRIKDYILQINEIKASLDEYEELAHMIEKLSNKKKTGEDMSKIVVDLREDKKLDRIKSTEEIINSLTSLEHEKREISEDIVEFGKVVGVKKKKSNNGSREL